MRLRFVQPFWSEWDLADLAKMVNTWIKENEVQVVDMKFTTHIVDEDYEVYCAFVIYEANEPIPFNSEVQRGD